jgi:predicted adenylyl cyclase CyaB
MTEVEVKIRIAGVEAAAEKLRGLGAVLVRPRAAEENVLYDFRDGALRRRREALRLRTTGKKCLLTFKGQPQPSRRFKVREEFETEVRSAGTLRKILHALGLRTAVRYRKFRAVYRLGHVLVCLDELSIGSFLELEGKRSDIVRTARALGYGSGDFIKSDYLELLAAAAAKRD